MPRSGIVRLYFSFLRTLYSVLHSGCANLIPTNCVGGFPCLHTLRHFLFVDFLMTAILTSVRWYPIVVWICISLIINDIEHLFMCLFTTCESSLEKCLFRSSAHFLWRRQWHPTPVLLPGECHGWRSLVGCRLWGRTELDTTEGT